MCESVEEIKKELEGIVSNLKERLGGLKTTNDVEEFLNDSVDVAWLVEDEGRQVVGFSILISIGNPYLEFDYVRGRAFIYARWGGAEITEPIDSDLARFILDVAYGYIDV